MTNFHDGAGARNWRNVINANTSSFNGTKIRITLTAGAYERNVVVDGSSIGLMTTADDMDAAANSTFKRITWVDEGGGNGITIPWGTTVVSDEIDFSFDKTKRYGIHLYMASRDNLSFGEPVGYDIYYNEVAADDTLTQVVGYGTWAVHTHIDKLEVFETVSFIPKVIVIT
jgi:hypothetical protein